MLPIASVVHAPGVEAHFDLHWWIIVTLVPLACVAMTSLGLVLGTSFEPRNIGLMFGFIVLPITFLGGTYYQWTRLAPVKVGGLHWLQTVVLINPLIYVNEGMRAAFTDASHMHLYIIYPVLVGFSALFLGSGCATSAAASSPDAGPHLAPAPPVSILFALLAAASNAAAAMSQHLANVTAPPGKVSVWRHVRYLLGQPMWLLGRASSC